MSLRTMALTAVTILGLFGCSGAVGQSSGPGDDPAVAEHASNSETVDNYPGCNTECYSSYTRAEASCEGDSQCPCFAQQTEGACLASCAGRIFIRRRC